MPSTWVAATTVVAVLPAPWQVAQVALAGWCEAAVSAGGAPWQEVQESVAAVVQAGVTLVAPTPPPRLPWQ